MSQTSQRHSPNYGISDLIRASVTSSSFRETSKLEYQRPSPDLHFEVENVPSV